MDNRTENTVLGGLICYPDEFDKIACYIPTEEVFVQKRAKALWNKINKMVRAGKQVDTITICESVTNNDKGQGLSQSYIVDCTSDISTGPMTEVYARTLYEKYLLRLVVTITDEIKQDAIHNGEDVYSLLTKAHSTIGELISINPSEKYDINELIINTISDIKNKDSNLVKTGYQKLDVFSGGLTRGEITIVGGRPGHGKTTFLINLVSKMRGEGHRCMLFNRELPNSEVIKNLYVWSRATYLMVW